ncbi:hypothetical protein [Achromobacter insolitus]|uniref:Uncharacterized protein n=1 Tax=Achromobacter insolitus TaxID=217204 RepID=A0A6S7F004_9BURK|nr:hypothetical protein [Achromobacter insolitus]CAB3931614.1 hypothetical protein LMG6000_02242 [Achromobacter insolitus]CAB3939485.1 hypothetical protein LMG5997_04059 [Achromobacter insolitus]
MNGWWIVLAGVGFLAVCLGLAVWTLASAYRRDAEEHGDFDDTEPK